MMCPVCKRDLAPTLSICLTCGAMINDTVREELETKIRTSDLVASTSGRLTAPKPAAKPFPKTPPPAMGAPSVPKPQPSTPTPAPVPPPKAPKTTPASATPRIPATKPPVAPKPIAARFETNDLHAKKTSPTLVEFQTKKATVPEWRLQLQNSVRQKVGTARREEAAPDATQTKSRTTSGANALKVEFVEEEEPRHKNPRVAKALERIEESRRNFSNQTIAEQSVHVGKASPAQSRKHPFNVVARSDEPAPPNQPAKPSVNASPKPMLVSPLRIEKKGFDTNKLPPLSKSGAISEKVELPVQLAKDETPGTLTRTRIVGGPLEIEEPLIEIDETDEIDDLAPLSMRFSAALFDFIIGTFASLILLSPFMLAGGDWLSLSGILAISASVAIVMFLYLTISIAFYGRTFGMRLFSLELVDIEENAYPTLHQAAVNSSVFLLSVGFPGVGFLPLFFNEERRAAHDILSGTILVREY